MYIISKKLYSLNLYLFGFRLMIIFLEIVVKELKGYLDWWVYIDFILLANLLD